MLLPPQSLTMAEISRREEVSEISLSSRRKQDRSGGCVGSETNQSPENGSVETKLAVILEAAGLTEIELGECCRCKDLYFMYSSGTL